jgi:hypothetical protein
LQQNSLSRDPFWFSILSANSVFCGVGKGLRVWFSPLDRLFRLTFMSGIQTATAAGKSDSDALVM